MNVHPAQLILLKCAMTKKTPTKKTPNFEKALSDLETLVDDMEQGNLSLEESLKRFEKGIALSTECQQALQNAELKIKQLVEKNGKLLEQDIELDD
jgi:exodeoxyribonuclease VII small subunit